LANVTKISPPGVEASVLSVVSVSYHTKIALAKSKVILSQMHDQVSCTASQLRYSERFFSACHQDVTKRQQNIPVDGTNLNLNYSNYVKVSCPFSTQILTPWWRSVTAFEKISAGLLSVFRRDLRFCTKASGRVYICRLFGSPTFSSFAIELDRSFNCEEMELGATRIEIGERPEARRALAHKSTRRFQRDRGGEPG